MRLDTESIPILVDVVRSLYPRNLAWRYTARDGADPPARCGVRIYPRADAEAAVAAGVIDCFTPPAG